ncbi:hypothetical protein VH88_11410 [Brevundimonas sp. KM4]|nr:hypothetical protein VH88_11410 [Brevundimonas sp. KM4]
MCGIVADLPDSVKFGKETGVEQVCILQQDQPVEMRMRRVILKSQLAKQFDDHRLGKPTQPDGHEVRLMRCSLFRLSPEIMEIWPEPLKEIEAIGVISDHFAALRTTTLAGMSDIPITVTTRPLIVVS